MSFIPSLIFTPDCEITLSSRTTTTVTLSNSAKSFLQVVNLQANVPQAVSIPVSACVPTTNDVKDNFAVHITANDPISVYAVNAGAAVADGALAYPEESYSSEYYVASYEGLSASAPASFIIVAAENNTIIEITPSVDTRGPHQAGIMYTVSLNKGETYMEFGTKDFDLTGTHIKARDKKKIAVYSGTKCVNIPKGCAACDVLMEQVIPVDRLGKKYLVGPFSDKTVTPKYTYRIVSTENNNKIFVNNVLLKTLKKGEVYTKFDETDPLCITSDFPIMVIEYTQGSNCTTIGDPAMVVMPPVEQFIDRVNYATPTYKGFLDHHVYVLIKKGTTLKINNVPVQPTKFSTFNSCSDYQYANIDLSAGNYLVECNEGFLMVAYGYGNFISYAYIGGTSFRNLRYDVKISNEACGSLAYDIENIGDTAEIISSKWNFGDGTSDTGKKVTKTYQKHGVYNVENIITLTAGNKIIVDTVTKKLATRAFPDADFKISNPVQCLNTNKFTFADSSKYLSESKYQNNFWWLGNSTSLSNLPSVTKTFTAPGKYDIKLVVVSSTNCSDTIVKQIEIKPSPQTDFAVQDTQCLAENLFSFQQLSTIDSTGKIESYMWSFGDNSSDTASVPKKIYADTGLYMVSLITKATNGCLDTLVKPVKIFPSPTASFTANDICLGDTAKFNNTSKSNGGGGLIHTWSLGDGTTTNTKNQDYYYKDSGLYIVKLKEENAFGCADSSSVNVYVYAKPKADFSASGSCEQKVITFTDKTAYYNIPLKENTWTFDNGQQVKNSVNPQTVYPTKGVKNIKLVVTNNFGCTDSIEYQKYINPTPVANFTFNNDKQCFKNNAFIVTNTSSISEGGLKTNSWYIDGAYVLGAASPINKSFSQLGGHTFKLVTESDSGCVDSVLKSIEVYPNSSVDVSINDTTQCFKGHQFKIVNTSKVNGAGSIVKYTWLFSDNTTQTTSSPTNKKFSADGKYTVTGIFETDKGCLDTFEANLTVYATPNIKFTANSICLGDSVLFDNQTTSSGNIVSWLWDFGDGTKSIEKSPYRKYKATGNYEVSLLAVTDEGCKDTSIVYFPDFVRPVPKVYFEDSLIESYEKLTTYKFESELYDADTYLWDFGDGTISNEKHPKKVYTDIGKFIVTLTGENKWQCKHYFTKELYVVPETYIFIPSAFSPDGKDNLNPVFRINGLYYAKEIEINIFSRWGEVLFHSTDFGAEWDGTYRGETVPEGAYLYSVRVMDLKNKIHIRRGTVTIIR